MFFKILYVVSLMASAKTEGMIINSTNETMQCMGTMLKGLKCLERVALPPGRGCMADAVLLPSGMVYKIPDIAVYVCEDETCRPFDIASQIIMTAASYNKGSEHYGLMTLERFEEFFPHRPYCDGTARQRPSVRLVGEEVTEEMESTAATR